MASKIRSGVKSILVSALFGLLISSFAIWGVGGGMFVSSNRVVATVGETEVETADLYRVVQNQARQYQQQYGAAVSAQDIILGLQLHTRTLQQMISSAALIDSATSLGLQGTDKQLLQEMLKVDAFQPIKKGVIDQEMLLQTLESAGMTFAKYEQSTKDEVAQGQLIDAITAATPVSRLLAEKLYAYRSETRTAALLSLPGTIVKNIPEPQDAEISDYYEARKSTYMAPEYRSYNYVLLTPESFEDKVEVNEEDLLKEFEYKQSEYSTPATRTVQQVSLESLEAANSFIERINAGEDFVTVAVELSDFTEEEITLPTSTFEQVEADFSIETANAVFALGVGEMSSPQEGFAGWSIFKVIDLTDGSSKSFEDVRAELEAAYVADQAVNLLYEFTDSVEEVLSEGGNLTEISTQLEIPMAMLTDIDVQGRGKEGTAAIQTEAGGIILRAAFAGEVGDYLEMKDMGANADDRRMYMLELTSVTEPEQKTLEMVESEVMANWEAEKRQEEIGRIAEDVLARIQAGEELETLAVEFDGTSYDAKNIRRTGTADSGISPTLRRLIFTMRTGDSDMEVAPDGEGYIIAKLNIIKSGDVAANSGQIDVLVAQLESSMSNELLSQYQMGLSKELEITVNEPLFQQTFSLPQQ